MTRRKLYRLTDIARIVGVSYERARQLRERRDFPAPVGSARQGRSVGGVGCSALGWELRRRRSAVGAARTIDDSPASSCVDAGRSDVARPSLEKNSDPPHWQSLGAVGRPPDRFVESMRLRRAQDVHAKTSAAVAFIRPSPMPHLLLARLRRHVDQLVRTLPLEELSRPEDVGDVSRDDVKVDRPSSRCSERV